MRHFHRLTDRLKKLKKIEWFLLVLASLIVLRLLIMPYIWFPRIIQPDFRIFSEQPQPSRESLSKYQDIKNPLKLNQSLQVLDSQGKQFSLNQEVHKIMLVTSSAMSYFSQSNGDTVAILNQDFREKKIEDQIFGNGSIDLYRKSENSWYLYQRLTPKLIHQLDEQANKCSFYLSSQFSIDEKSLIFSCQDSVYIFSQVVGKWIFKQKISNQDIPDGFRDDKISEFFASQVIHSSKTLVIRPHENLSSSRIKIFELDATDQRWKFKQFVGEVFPFDYLSEQRIAFDGNIIAVGYPDARPDGFVQIYRQDGDGAWKTAEKILPGKIDRLGYFFEGESGLIIDSYGFGGSIAIRGNYMIIACKVVFGPLKRAKGEVLLFERDPHNNHWKPFARLGTTKNSPSLNDSVDKTYLWGFSKVYLSDNFAAVTTRPLGVSNKDFPVVHLYNLHQ